MKFQLMALTAAVVLTGCGESKPSYSDLEAEIYQLRYENSKLRKAIDNALADVRQSETMIGYAEGSLLSGDFSDGVGLLRDTLLRINRAKHALEN